MKTAWSKRVRPFRIWISLVSSAPDFLCNSIFKHVSWQSGRPFAAYSASQSCGWISRAESCVGHFGPSCLAGVRSLCPGTRRQWHTWPLTYHQNKFAIIFTDLVLTEHILPMPPWKSLPLYNLPSSLIHLYTIFSAKPSCSPWKGWHCVHPCALQWVVTSAPTVLSCVFRGVWSAMSNMSRRPWFGAHVLSIAESKAETAIDSSHQHNVASETDIGHPHCVTPAIREQSAATKAAVPRSQSNCRKLPMWLYGFYHIFRPVWEPLASCCGFSMLWFSIGLLDL